MVILGVLAIIALPSFLNQVGKSFDNKYIDSYNITTNSGSATVAPVNNEYQRDNTRGYSGGVFFNNAAYMTII